MRVKEIMTHEPVCCTPDINLRDVAQMMVEHDCGEIPVVDDLENLKPLGVITDRDIVCRTVAKGENPLEMIAGDCLSSPCVTVEEDASLDECCRTLEENQVRRVPVVDETGRCCGIVSVADIARNTSEPQTGEVVKYISRP